ncbi:lysine transporter LysE [Desulfurococcaceae archaeon AG1]|jgi:threonine/homoserine/homoserine lactone efflux protein|nr:lysine transporter LysE [Desulfurococcaceae archaeon AG1]
MPLTDPLFGFVSGLLYGFSLAVPPGPMNALIASRSLYSYREGFLTGLGAMTADLIFMILTYTAYGFIKSLSLVPVYLAGGVYMIILALWILRARVDNSANRTDRGNKVGSLVSFLSALALGMTNPYQILWWLSAGLSFMDLFGFGSILGLFIAILIWILTFPLAIRTGYMYGKGVAALAIKIFSVSVMLIFAALILYRGFSILILRE